MSVLYFSLPGIASGFFPVVICTQLKVSSYDDHLPSSNSLRSSSICCAGPGTLNNPSTLRPTGSEHYTYIVKTANVHTHVLLTSCLNS